MQTWAAVFLSPIPFSPFHTGGIFRTTASGCPVRGASLSGGKPATFYTMQRSVPIPRNKAYPILFRISVVDIWVRRLHPRLATSGRGTEQHGYIGVTIGHAVTQCQAVFSKRICATIKK